MLQHLTNTLELAAEMLRTGARSEMSLLGSTALKTEGFDTDSVGVFFVIRALSLMVACDGINFKDFTVRQNENHKILLALTC